MKEIMPDGETGAVIAGLSAMADQIQAFAKEVEAIQTLKHSEQNAQIRVKAKETFQKIRDLSPGEHFNIPLDYRDGVSGYRYAIFEKNNDGTFYVHEVNVGSSRTHGQYDKPTYASFATKSRFGQTFQLNADKLEGIVCKFVAFVARDGLERTCTYEKLWGDEENLIGRSVPINEHAALRGDLFVRFTNNSPWSSLMALSRMTIYQHLLLKNPHGTPEKQKALVKRSGEYVRLVEFFTRLGMLSVHYDRCLGTLKGGVDEQSLQDYQILRESVGGVEFFLRKYGKKLLDAVPKTKPYVEALENLYQKCVILCESPEFYEAMHRAEKRNAFSETVVSPPDMTDRIKGAYRQFTDGDVTPRAEIKRPQLDALTGNYDQIISAMKDFSFDQTSKPYDYAGIFYAKELMSRLPLANDSFWTQGNPETHIQKVVIFDVFIKKLAEHMANSFSSVTEGALGSRYSWLETQIVDLDNAKLPWRVAAPFAAEVENLRQITFRLVTMPGGLGGVPDNSLSEQYSLGCPGLEAFAKNDACKSMSAVDRERLQKVLNLYKQRKSLVLDFSMSAGKWHNGIREYSHYYGGDTDDCLRLWHLFSEACPNIKMITADKIRNVHNEKETAANDKFFDERKYAYFWAGSINDKRYTFSDEHAHWESIRRILEGISGINLVYNTEDPHSPPGVRLLGACIQSDQLSRLWDYHNRSDYEHQRIYNDENHISALDPKTVVYNPVHVCRGEGIPETIEYYPREFLKRGAVSFAEHPLFYEIGKALSAPGAQVYSLLDIINTRSDLFTNYGCCISQRTGWSRDDKLHGNAMLFMLLDNLLFANFKPSERPHPTASPGRRHCYYSMDGKLFEERPFASRPIFSIEDEIRKNPQKLFGVLQDTYNSAQRLYREMRPFQRPDVRAICYVEHLVHKCQKIHMKVNGSPFGITGDSAFPSREKRLQQLEEVGKKFGRALSDSERAILHLAKAELAVEQMGFLGDDSKIAEADDAVLVGFYENVFGFRAMELEGIPNSCYETILGAVTELGSRLCEDPDRLKRTETQILENFGRHIGETAPDNSWVDFSNFHVFWGGQELQPATAFTSTNEFKRIFGMENYEFVNKGHETSFVHPNYGTVKLFFGRINVKFEEQDQWWQYANTKVLRSNLEFPAWIESEPYAVWINSEGQLQIRDQKDPKIIYFQSKGDGDDWKLECTFEPYKGLFLAVGHKSDDATWLTNFENEENCAFFVDADNKLQKVWVPRYGLSFELRDGKWMQRGTNFQLVDAPNIQLGENNVKSNPLGTYKSAIFLHNTKKPNSYKILMPHIGFGKREENDERPAKHTHSISGLDPLNPGICTDIIPPSIHHPFMGSGSVVEAHFEQHRRNDRPTTKLDGLSNDGNLQLGVIFLMQEDYDRAAEYFKRLHAGVPLSPAHHKLLIDSLLKWPIMKGYSGKAAAVHMLLLEKWSEMYGLDSEDIAKLKCENDRLRFEDNPLAPLLIAYLVNLPSIPLQLRMDPFHERRLFEHLECVGIFPGLKTGEPIIAKRVLSLDHLTTTKEIPDADRAIVERLQHYDPLLSGNRVLGAEVEAVACALVAPMDPFQALPMQNELFSVENPLGKLRKALLDFRSNSPPDPESSLHLNADAYAEKLSQDDRDNIGDAFKKSIEELNGEIQIGAKQLALKRARNEQLGKMSHDYAKICADIENCRQRMRKTTRDQHEKLVGLVNKPHPMLATQNVAICATPIKLKAVIAVFGQFATQVPPDVARFFHFLQKYNPNITVDDVRQISEHAHNYMRHKIMFRRMANLLQDIQDLSNAGQGDNTLLSALQSRLFDHLEEWEETYDPESYPYALLNEYASGKHARRAQIDILRKLCENLTVENSVDTVVQMQMGAGKTSVVIPIYASQAARHGKLAFICAHNRSQFDALCGELASGLSRLNMRVVPIKFTLQETSEPRNLSWLLQEMQTALQERDRTFIIDPTTIETLEAQFKLLARTPQRNETDEFCFNTLIKFFAYLQENGLFIGDEIDRILNPQEYLNVSLPQANGLVAEMLQEDLDFISDMIVSLGEICPEFLQNQQHLMSSERVQEVLQQLSEMVLEKNFAIQLSPKMHASFLKYVLGQYDNLPKNEADMQREADEFLAFFRQQKDQATAELQKSIGRILMARGLLSTLLPHLFTQKYNQNFGFGPDGACIPFKGPNEPNLGSEFKNCYQTACCFFAGISIDGIPMRMIKGYADMLSRLTADEDDQRKAFDEFNAIFKDCEYEGRPVTIDLLITTANSSEKEKIYKCMWEFLRQGDRVGERQVVARIFAKGSIHFSTQSVESKSAQFPQLFSRTVGFSGTISNRDVYNFEKVCIQLQEGSDGQVIARNCELMGIDTHPIHFVDNEGVRPTAKMLLENYAKSSDTKRLRALIDGGALLNGQHPRDVARDILAFTETNTSGVQHVLYYDPDTQSFFVLSRGQIEPVEIRPMDRATLAAAVGDLKALFVYYDEQRCTGTDLPLPSTCEAVQTIDPSWSTIDRNAQANIRLRAFRSSQIIKYVALEKSREHFLCLTGTKEPSIADIYVTLLLNQLRNVTQQQALASFDKVDTIIDDFIWRTTIKLASDRERLTAFTNAIAELLTKVDDFSREAMFFELTRTVELREAVEFYWNQKVQLLRKKLDEVQMSQLLDAQTLKFNEAQKRILSGTTGIHITTSAGGYTNNIDASVQVEVQQQTTVEVNCNISVNLQLENFVNRVTGGELRDPREEDLLVVDGPTDIHAFFTDRSRSIRDQIEKHGGPMSQADRDIYFQFAKCFPNDLFLSINFAQSCKTERTIFDSTQKHCTYLVITWDNEKSSPRAVAISKQEYNTLRKHESNLQNCCIYLAGTGTCLYGQLPEPLKEFRQRKLCETAVFNANISYLLRENSDLVAQVMAANGNGDHDQEILKLRQDFLLFRTCKQDREDVKITISHTLSLGMGHGKTWPKNQVKIPAVDDIPIPLDRPDEISKTEVLQSAKTEKTLCPRLAIALTVIAALLLAAAAAALVFTNVIGVLALGIWGYAILFSPGAIFAVVAIALWTPRRVVAVA
jgi:hypothetical protein